MLPGRCADVSGDSLPWNPGSAVEPCRQPEMARDPPRQNHGLERVQQNHANNDAAENNGGNAKVMDDHASFVLRRLSGFGLLRSRMLTAAHGTFAAAHDEAQVSLGRRLS